MLKNNYIVRLLLICLTMVLLGGTFAGCSGSTNPGQDTTGATDQPSGDDASVVTVCEDGTVKTQIVFSATSNRTMRNAATRLQARLAEVTGVTVPFTTDRTSAQGGEILLGLTNRFPDVPELAEAEIMVTRVGDHILLLAQDSDLWEDAIELLIANLKQNGTVWYLEKDLMQCQTVEKNENSISLRVATFNIHLGGQDVKYDLSVLAEDIRQSGADVIGLQEVDKNTLRNKNQDTMKILGELTGYYYYFAPAINTQGGQYGNGLLSRFPIESADYVVLPEGGYENEEQRVVLQACLNVNGTKLYFYCTHFNQWAADASMKAIYKLARPNDPFIVVGDFNYQNFDVFNQNFPDCTKVNNAAVNWKTTYDGYMFDNIILSKSIEKIRACLIDTTDANGKRHSDHLMVVADIRIILPES